MTGRARTSRTDEPRRSRQVGEQPSEGRNLAAWERLASVALGGFLLARDFRRGSLPGAASAVASGWLLYRGVTGRDPLYRVLGVSTRDRTEPGTSAGALAVERTVTVRGQPEELYERWRDPEQVSRMVGEFADVTPADDERWRWTARAPLGRTVSWASQTVEARPGETLHWESLDGAPVPNEGTVRFRSAPGDQGTEVTLSVAYDPPGGALGKAAMGRFTAAPEALVGETLRRFKSLAETGEIATLERNSSGRGSGDIV